MDIDDFLDKEQVKDEEPGKQTAEEEPNTGIFQDIEHIRGLLEQGKLGEAHKRYEEAKEKFAIYIKEQQQEESQIYDQLMKINHQMLEALNKQKEDVQHKVKIIKELEARTYKHLQAGETDLASKLAKQIDSYIQSLPDDYQEKLNVEKDFMALKLEVRKRTDSMSGQRFNELYQKIQQLLNFGFGRIQQGDYSQAQQIYQKADELYKQLPEGFLYEKAAIYRQMLKFFKSVHQSGQQENTNQKVENGDAKQPTGPS